MEPRESSNKSQFELLAGTAICLVVAAVPMNVYFWSLCFIGLMVVVSHMALKSHWTETASKARRYLTCLFGVLVIALIGCLTLISQYQSEHAPDQRRVHQIMFASLLFLKLID